MITIKRNIKINITRQCGQSLIAGLFLAVLAIAGVVLMFNTSQTTTEKMKVVNAADAAAYSGAIWAARQLNYMAYTNRAMIANHVAVGHLVSFVSWIRYVEKGLEDLYSYTFWIPYVGQAIGAAEQYADYYRQGSESFSNGYIPAIDNLNRALSSSQLVALANLNPITLQSVMNSTAADYGNVTVNNPQLFDSLTTTTLTYAQIGYEQQEILRFTQSYSPENDNGRIQRLVDDSLDKSEAWVRGNRGWRICLYGTCSRIPGNIRSAKKGTTIQIQRTQETAARGGSGSSSSSFGSVVGNNGFALGSGGCSGSDSSSSSGLDWYAKDDLEIELARIRRFRVRWRTLFEVCADATAQEFDTSYAGIHDYRALRNQERADNTLSLTAISATPIREARPHQFIEAVNNPRLDVKDSQAIGSSFIFGLARAEIYHAPPEVKSLLRRSGEYANLYNPFWQVHLTEDQIHKVLGTVAGL